MPLREQPLLEVVRLHPPKERLHAVVADDDSLEVTDSSMTHQSPLKLVAHVLLFGAVAVLRSLVQVLQLGWNSQFTSNLLLGVRI